MWHEFPVAGRIAAAVALLLAACTSAPEPAGKPAVDIVGPVWVAEDIAGGGVVDDSRITLRLGADGRAGGRGGCNGYGGSYTLAGEALSFGPLAATKMACAEAITDQEQRYFDTLARVTRYAVADDGALLLTTPEGTIRFRRE